MNTLSTTLKDYKDNYQSNLDAFLNEYEDNTKKNFLQEELKKYQNYHDSLILIPKKLKYPSVEDIKNLSILSSVASKLKKLCPKAYDDIVTIKLLKIDFEEDNLEFLLPSAIPSLINIDFIKLQHYINSSLRILDFINDKINPPSIPTLIYQKQNSPKEIFLGEDLPQTNKLAKADIEIDVVTDENTPNNILKSTIDDYLEEFKKNVKHDGYELLVKALEVYFMSGTFPILSKKINFFGVNKKKVGWALKELYKSEKTDAISYEYLLFAKENINLFEKVILSKEDFKTCNLYKYFTTNPTN